MCSRCLGLLISKQVSFVASTCPLCRVPINLGDIENEFSVAMEEEFVQIRPRENEPSIAMQPAFTPIVRLSMLQNTILVIRHIRFDGDSMSVEEQRREMTIRGGGDPSRTASFV
jgi:hypothetical protein